MKKILFLSLALSSTLSWGEELKWKARPEAALLDERGFTFTALDAQIRLLAKQKEFESADLELLEELVLKASVEALEEYDRKLLERFPVASVQFLLGREAFKENRASVARGYLVNVPRWHRYYPEARLLLAQLADKSSAAEAFEDQCVDAAKKRAGEVNSPLLKRYYTVLGEDCQVIRARKLYKAGDYAKALEAYGQIDKRAYKWPYLLLERAWAHYNLKDYNRSLGMLVTYKAPLMSSYFLPEAEVLTALGYFRMCLYDDALVVVDQFYTNYKPRTEALEALLKSQLNSQTYFYELMKMGPKERAKLHPFIAQLAVQIGQRPRFALDYANVAKVQAESDRLAREFHGLASRHGARGWMKDSLQQLTAMRDNLTGRINYHAKKDMLSFVSDVYMLSEELFKVKLEIIARKKDLVYGQKKLISDRGRGSFDEVKRSRFEAFWKFHGAFWADELGDFSFGLASNCSTVKREVPVE